MHLQVMIYDHRTHVMKRTISRFPDTAYGATIRSDGQLLVAGCENGHVMVFSTSSRTVLRQFTQHKAATRVALFSIKKTQVFSGSDDATIRLWDLAAGGQVARMVGHTDYVRAGAVVSEEVLASGSYDHSVRVWDSRTRESQMHLDHGSPVESIVVFPNGRIAASAGGTTVKLWDLAAGGRALQTIRNHQKTVACAQALDVRDSEGVACSKLLTGSLDGHVKVYDMDTLQVTYAYKYPAGVTAVSVAPDLSCMVVAMTDRSMVVRRHKNGLGAISAMSTFPL
jgi:U3 small nucleolar RNA-associated protein 15